MKEEQKLMSNLTSLSFRAPYRIRGVLSRNLLNCDTCVLTA